MRYQERELYGPMCSYLCARKGEKRERGKHWGRQKWNETARAEDSNNVPLSSINLYLFFTSCKVIDDADIGLLATYSTNLLLSQSLENGFGALSCVSTRRRKNQSDAK